jgi:hypothetical protein
MNELKLMMNSESMHYLWWMRSIIIRDGIFGTNGIDEDYNKIRNNLKSLAFHRM